ncbi:MAG: phosphohistidine phosphatase SixA [Candidatus Bathyarchaeota archaeon]|nr:MAG: phosphohistidine phosphatase SixA [Candidatus Bathyarchaeota archaeon]
MVQHAEAKSKEEDPLRPLSRKGWQNIRKVARYASETLAIQVDKIFHSSKLRAKQTAEVLASYLGPVQGVAIGENLEPLANPAFWKTQLSIIKEDIVVVGHLPHLSKLANQLLVIGETEEKAAFRNAGILCLQKTESDHWTIEWMITPEMIT